MAIQLMTVEQAFNKAINTYPSLFTSNTLENAKMGFYEHMFNIIGNGYSSNEAFIKDHVINEKNKNLLNSFPSKDIGNETLYSAYTELEETDYGPRGVYESALPGLYTKEELELMTNVVFTLQRTNKKEIKALTKEEENSYAPYPNFKKDFSFVWKINLKMLDVSWIDAALFYYEKMLKFFHSEDSSNYSNAYPKNEETLQKRIDNYESAFKKYQKEDMSLEEYYKIISEEYEENYDGDTKKFIQNKWDREKKSIIEFIEETITMLNEEKQQRTSLHPVQ